MDLVLFFIGVVMARRCKVTGIGVQSGHHVSHANNKTNRRFLPNLRYKRFWSENEGRFIRLRVSARGLRTLDKVGVDVVLSNLRAQGIII